MLAAERIFPPLPFELGFLVPDRAIILNRGPKTGHVDVQLHSCQPIGIIATYSIGMDLLDVIVEGLFAKRRLPASITNGTSGMIRRAFVKGRKVCMAFRTKPPDFSRLPVRDARRLEDAVLGGVPFSGKLRMCCRKVVMPDVKNSTVTCRASPSMDTITDLGLPCISADVTLPSNFKIAHWRII